MDELIPYGLTEAGVMEYLASWESQRTVVNTQAGVDETDAYANNPDNTNTDVATAYVMNMYSHAVFSLPEVSDIEPTDAYVNNIFLDSLDSAGNAGAFTAATTVKIVNFLTDEVNELVDRLTGGDPYTYPTEAQVEDITGELPEEADPLFTDIFAPVGGVPILVDNGGGSGDPGDPGGGEDPGGDTRADTVNEYRPQDGSLDFYFDILAYSDGTDLANQVVQDYMDNTLQDTALYDAMVTAMGGV